MANQTFDLKASRERCQRIRRRILEISQGVAALHIGGSFSCLEIVDTVYFSLMRHKNEVAHPDTFILSKGHGSMAQYVVLEERGVLSREDLEGYCKKDGRLGTHPDYGLPGIEASTGSLGHGLGMAIGMSLADRVRNQDRVIYVVMSDGELQEGSVWEAMMIAPSFGITNVVAFIDLNNMQSFGHTTDTHPNFYPVAEKTRSFGWETVEIDEHDAQAVYEAVINRSGTSPLIVIAKTVKGKGISYMENVAIWHYRSPSPEEYQQALQELGD